MSDKRSLSGKDRRMTWQNWMDCCAGSRICTDSRTQAKPVRFPTHPYFIRIVRNQDKFWYRSCKLCLSVDCKILIKVKLASRETANSFSTLFLSNGPLMSLTVFFHQRVHTYILHKLAWNCVLDTTVNNHFICNLEFWSDMIQILIQAKLAISP